MMKFCMQRTAFLIVAALFGCASAPIVSTGTDTYVIDQPSAGGIFRSGSSVLAGVSERAIEFCAKQGKTMQRIDATPKNAIPFARMPSAELNFRCMAAN